MNQEWDKEDGGAAGQSAATGLRKSRRVAFWRRHKLGMFALVLVSTSLIASVLLPLVMTLEPNSQDLMSRFLPPLSTSESMGKFYLLGTDSVGRDVLARVLYGGRISLSVAGLGLVLAGAVGLSLGTAAGFFGGRVDNVIMRVVDAQLALPVLIAALFVGSLLGTGFWETSLTLGIAGWPIYARLMRADVLRIREEEFLQASRSMGGTDWWLITKHVLPNLISTLAVVASLEMGRLILIESSLSYLGMGMQPPTASWGSMIRSAQAQIQSAPHLSIVPGLAIVWTVLGLNLLGDWVRDVLDPRID